MGGVAWTEEEDNLLRKCIEQYGEGKWHRVPLLAGLNRCRKSCRLRWLNYLRPNIKRGRFTEEEVELIIKLHKLLGNRWSLIAGRLPGRTANDVKNFWNCHLSKKLSTNLHHLDNNNTESNHNCNKKMPSAHIPIKEVNNVTSLKSSSSSTSTTSNQPQSIIGAAAAPPPPPSTLMLETTYAAYDHHNIPDRGVDIGSELGIAAAAGSTCCRLSNKFDHMNITTTTNMAAAFHTHNNNNLLQHGGDGMNLQLGGSGGGGDVGYLTSNSIMHNVDHNQNCNDIDLYDHTILFNYGGTEHHHNHNYNQHHNHGMMCSVYGGQDNDDHQFIEMDEFDLEVEMKMCNNHNYYYEHGKSKWDLDDLVMDMDLWSTTTTTTTTTIDHAL